MISFRKKKQKLDSLSNEALFQLYASTESKESFSEIYNRFSRIIYGTCLKYLNNRDESSDMTMNIFEDLMHKIPSQKNIQSVDNWVYFVTKNKCITHVRNSKKIIFEPFDEKYIEKRSGLFMENEGFLRLNNREQQDSDEIISKSIKQLNPEQRACIQAFYLEKKSYKQIETELGFPLVKVKSYIQNGKRNLKTLIENTQISNNP